MAYSVAKLTQSTRFRVKSSEMSGFSVSNVVTLIGHKVLYCCDVMRQLTAATFACIFNELKQFTLNGLRTRSNSFNAKLFQGEPVRERCRCRFFFGNTIWFQQMLKTMPIFFTIRKGFCGKEIYVYFSVWSNLELNWKEETGTKRRSIISIHDNYRMEWKLHVRVKRRILNETVTAFLQQVYDIQLAVRMPNSITRF